MGCEPEHPGAYRPDWAEAGGRERLLAAARRHLIPVDAPGPGRVLIFRWRDGLPAKHCAIATDTARMIHAHDGGLRGRGRADRLVAASSRRELRLPAARAARCFVKEDIHR